VVVESELGEGSSFRVCLPRAEGGEAEAAPPPQSAPAASGGETVLVVEDADGLRGLIRKMLELRGYKVLVAANAEQALELFERHERIDLLLSDVVMPGATGPELTLQLIARHPSLKVVYMSGYTEEAIVHHGVLNPGIAFLQKPFGSETLARKIREQLDR
jgi:DNA-binding NtrC family response regulator